VKRPTLTLFFISICGNALACLWDSDTLATELKGKLTVQNALAGRIERNPPEYYERRLEIARAKIERNPDDLLAYDDAGVSCDRLNRSDQAIDWMKRKRVNSRNASDNDRYRTEANEGTFRIHRWISRGFNLDEVEEARIAREMIAKAVAINPNAHFGRERVQLAIMNWMIENKTEVQQYGPRRLSQFLFTTLADRERLREGLIGLMMLGNAWESIDIIEALANSYSRHPSLGYLAELRIKELQAAGKESLTKKPTLHLGHGSITDVQKRDIDASFQILRANAEEFRKKRTDFILAV